MSEPLSSNPLSDARSFAAEARAHGHDPHKSSNSYWLVYLDDEIERLTRQDEVHWKTRRTLLADIERLRAALEKIAAWYPSEQSQAGWTAREALRPADETVATTTSSMACHHPVGNYRCDVCGIEVRTAENGSDGS